MAPVVTFTFDPKHQITLEEAVARIDTEIRIANNAGDLLDPLDASSYEGYSGVIRLPTSYNGDATWSQRSYICSADIAHRRIRELMTSKNFFDYVQQEAQSDAADLLLGDVFEINPKGRFDKIYSSIPAREAQRLVGIQRALADKGVKHPTELLSGLAQAIHDRSGDAIGKWHDSPNILSGEGVRLAYAMSGAAYYLAKRFNSEESLQEYFDLLETTAKSDEMTRFT